MTPDGLDGWKDSCLFFFGRDLFCSGAGGYTSYVPLAYEKSCKVVIRGKGMRFYQINYATYADDAKLETYPGPDDEAFMAKIEKACRLFSEVGTDISEHAVSPGTKVYENVPHGKPVLDRG